MTNLHPETLAQSLDAPDAEADSLASAIIDARLDREDIEKKINVVLQSLHGIMKDQETVVGNARFIVEKLHRLLVQKEAIKTALNTKIDAAIQALPLDEQEEARDHIKAATEWL